MTNVVTRFLSSQTLAWAPGAMELGIILIIALVLFGNRLPGTMRSLGQSLKEFKKGMKEGEEGETSDRLH
jgi:sec-independent protein translocase protein TatA